MSFEFGSPEALELHNLRKENKELKIDIKRLKELDRAFNMSDAEQAKEIVRLNDIIDFDEWFAGEPRLYKFPELEIKSEVIK